MRTSLIVTTYNRPRALSLVLESIAWQSVLPDEVIVADDGSEPATRDVVFDKSKHFKIPLIHKWQPDKGFRVARARNLGASAASGEYLIFVDGDTLLHGEFVRSHLYHRGPGRFLHGSRVLISDLQAEHIMHSQRLPSVHFFTRGILNRFNTIHNLPLSNLFSNRTSVWRSRGSNISMYARDFAAVNGFNEDFVGWGKEDSEFAWRLIKSGVEKVNLRCCGVTYHLGHEWNNERADTETYQQNTELLDCTMRSGIVRCSNGLNNHLETPVLEQDTE